MPELAGPLSIPTGITLDYEAPKWGAMRLMLDGISNHLDAVGTLKRISVRLQPDRVVIADDGPGYDAALLGLLYSTRRDDPATIGQFGEGLKLVATAALRAGLKFAVRSRDWQANAVAAPVSFEAAPGEQRTVMQLVWEVAPAERISGSRTIVSRSPLLPPDISLAFAEWRRHFLPDDQRLVSSAWASPQPVLFVKGVFVRPLEHHHFAYNLPHAAINRDRDMVDVNNELARFWAGVTDPTLAASFLLAAHGAVSGVIPAFQEARLWFSPQHREVWAQAFAATFGAQAVLSTADGPSYHATAAGYTPIRLPGSVAYALERIVPRDCDVVTMMDRYACRPLSDGEAAVIGQVRSLVARADGAGPFKVVAMTTPPSGLLGIADVENQTIAIAESALRSVEDALPVYLEEHAHLASGKGDFERGFEVWLVTFGARALTRTGASGGSHDA